MPKVVITGATGFVGRNLTATLKEYEVIPMNGKNHINLLSLNNLITFLGDHRPDYLVHCAGVVGGIQFNKNNPVKMITDNLDMGINVVKACSFYDIKLVNLGTVCAYPNITPIPFKEDFLWEGYPEPTNAKYGLAKRLLIEMTMAYHQEGKLRCCNILPANLYGIGDNFSEVSSHVLPAMINKTHVAIKNNHDLTLFGTGKPTRELLHVKDLCRAIKLAMELYDQPDPINIGTGIDISISNLAKLVTGLMGFKGKIVWDDNYPDGQMSRRLDVSKAKRLLGFQSEIKLEDAIVELINWYNNTYRTAYVT